MGPARRRRHVPAEGSAPMTRRQRRIAAVITEPRAAAKAQLAWIELQHCNGLRAPGRSWPPPAGNWELAEPPFFAVWPALATETRLACLAIVPAARAFAVGGQPARCAWRGAGGEPGLGRLAQLAAVAAAQRPGRVMPDTAPLQTSCRHARRVTKAALPGPTVAMPGLPSRRLHRNAHRLRELHERTCSLPCNAGPL